MKITIEEAVTNVEVEQTNQVILVVADFDVQRLAIERSIIDAKGDLIVGTADNTPVRFPIEGDGQVPISDSGEACGMKWADFAAGGYVQLLPFGYDIPRACAVGDGKAYLPGIPPTFNGLSLIYCHAENETAGVGGGPMAIQIHNVTQAVDMLSTKLTIDSGETGSDTAATPAVIKENGDEVLSSYDILRLDFDVIHDAPAEGCVVTLGFG